ncbi:IS3 family transposase [Desulfohalovibrio reitneri]|uniref:IS3 family transposase n=1 Tax=Desulfohalovibrio reitneri TaxID=1307759 RepID=UPI00069100A9|nr:IS3 family transposase [Desulfohalovibrio reitneri]
MKRGPYAKVAERNADLLARIRGIKADHPFWGYRRVWAFLRFVDGVVVGQNRVYRLMSEHDLTVKPNLRLKAKRRPTGVKPRPTRPNEWWGIDMTKIKIDGYGWLYVVIVLDWRTKKVVGHYAGDQAKAWHWLSALNAAVGRQFPEGVRDGGLHLMADNGCQPTSTSFMKACRVMDIKLAFTSYNNPKGNADTERFMRTMKEELVWINEWRSPTAFYQALGSWIEEYNQGYLHSALGYKTPVTTEQELINSRTLLKKAC